jgi:hypothetical protein
VVFGQLSNGGFEAVRPDGTPYAWRKFGGSYRSTTSPRSEGDHSLEFASSTESTKWVYQTIDVIGGAYYQGTASGLNNDSNVEGVFLRVSFYESDDGSGRAMSSVDSEGTLSGNDPDFVSLSTGVIQAPQGANTAKLRLMLRPASGALGIAFFDSASFERVAPTPAALQPTGDTDQSPVTPQATPYLEPGAPAASGAIAAITPFANPTPTTLGVESTPRALANVHPPDGIGAPQHLGTNGRSYDWLIAVAIGLPAVGFAALGFAELRISARKRKGE